MPKNIEIKARVEDVMGLTKNAKDLSTHGPTYLSQDDTFFSCPNGRLKLRVMEPERGELIFYTRENRRGPKESTYVIAATSEPDRLRDTLTQAYGQAGRVVKRRTLFLAGRTRIHVDEVAFLGHFVELEVVLEEGEALERGTEEAQVLMERLGIKPEQLVDKAYVELLADAAQPESA